MCHSVRQMEGYFFLKRGDWLIGYKELKWRNGNFRPVYINRDCYSLKPTDVGIFVAVVEAPVVSQEIMFDIVVKEGGVSTWGGILVGKEAGCHICAFFDSHRFWVSPGGSMVIPVAFHQGDVVFFDGLDISVRRFYILTPSMMERLLSEEGDVIKETEGFRENYKNLAMEVERCVTL